MLRTLSKFIKTSPTVEELEDTKNYETFEDLDLYDDAHIIGSGPYYVIEIDPNNNKKVVNYGNYEGLDHKNIKSPTTMPEKICNFTNKKEVGCDLTFYKKIQKTGGKNIRNHVKPKNQKNVAHQKNVKLLHLLTFNKRILI